MRGRGGVNGRRIVQAATRPHRSSALSTGKRGGRVDRRVLTRKFNYDGTRTVYSQSQLLLRGVFSSSVCAASPIQLDSHLRSVRHLVRRVKREHARGGADGCIRAFSDRSLASSVLLEHANHWFAWTKCDTDRLVAIPGVKGPAARDATQESVRMYACIRQRSYTHPRPC